MPQDRKNEDQEQITDEEIRGTASEEDEEFEDADDMEESDEDDIEEDVDEP